MSRLGFETQTLGLFWTTTSILLPCLGERKNEHRLVLEPFVGNCNRAHSLYSHCYCITKQVKTIARAYTPFIIIRIESHEITVYTLFRTERTKPIPCPAARPRTTSSPGRFSLALEVGREKGSQGKAPWGRG